MLVLGDTGLDRAWCTHPAGGGGSRHLGLWLVGDDAWLFGEGKFPEHHSMMATQTVSMSAPPTPSQLHFPCAGVRFSHVHGFYPSWASLSPTNRALHSVFYLDSILLPVRLCTTVWQQAGAVLPALSAAHAWSGEDAMSMGCWKQRTESFPGQVEECSACLQKRPAAFQRRAENKGKAAAKEASTFYLPRDTNQI